MTAGAIWLVHAAVMLARITPWDAAALPEEPAGQWAAGAIAADLLAADAHDWPGPQVFAPIADPPGLVCLGLPDETLWRYVSDTGLPTAGAALSPNGLLALPTERAVLCLDPATGAERWRHEAPLLPGAPAVWAALDGGETAALLAATQDGVIAIAADGALLWETDGDASMPPPAGPLVAASIRGETVIFVPGARGPAALDAEGGSRWRHESDTPFNGEALLVTLEEYGVPLLLCLSGNGVHAFDAEFGDPVWEILDFDAPPRALAAMDHEARGGALAAVLDGRGHVALIDAAGTVQRRLEGAVSAGAGLYAAMDGVASGGAEDYGGRPYLLAADILGWREPALVLPRPGSALPYAPAVSEADDAHARVLFVPGERSVRAFALPGALPDRLVPWPMTGGNPARTQSDAPPALEAPVPRLGGRPPPPSPPPLPSPVQESLELLRNGGFAQPHPEDAALPLGWRADPGFPMRRTAEERLGGAHALEAGPSASKGAIVSDPQPVEAEVTEVTGSIMYRGAPGVTAALEWFAGDVRLGDAPFVALPLATDTGWTRFALRAAPRPYRADAFRVRLEHPPLDAPVHWDMAQITGAAERLPEAGIFHNLAGYEPHAPKQFTAYANFRPSIAEFEILDMDGSVVHGDALDAAQRIRGGGDSDWGWHYLRGDFTDFAEEGSYRIRVRIGDLTAESGTFEIAHRLLWNNSAPLALGALAPAAEELAADPFGAPEAFPLLWDLLRAYDISRGALSPGQGTRAAARIQAALEQAGGEMAARAGAGSPEAAPPYREAAFLARLARIVPERWLEAAESAFAALGVYGGEDPQAVRIPEDSADAAWIFSAAVDLLAASDTGEHALAAHLSLQSASDKACPESLGHFDTLFDTIAVMQRVARSAPALEAALGRAGNPFGVHASEHANGPYFFTPDVVTGGERPDHAARALEAALEFARLYRYAPRKEYLAFIFAQLDWMLGNNPAGVSLVKGVGEEQPPCWEESAGKGAVAVGLHARASGGDRPWFDAAGCAPDPRTAIAYFGVLANLRRLPSAQDVEP